MFDDCHLLARWPHPSIALARIWPLGLERTWVVTTKQSYGALLMTKTTLPLDNSRRHSVQSTTNVHQPSGNAPSSQLVTTGDAGLNFAGLPVQANTSHQNASVFTPPINPPPPLNSFGDAYAPEYTRDVGRLAAGCSCTPNTGRHPAVAGGRVRKGECRK